MLPKETTMKRNILIGLLLAFMMMLITACGSTGSDASKFEGTWIAYDKNNGVAELKIESLHKQAIVSLTTYDYKALMDEASSGLMDAQILRRTGETAPVHNDYLLQKKNGPMYSVIGDVSDNRIHLHKDNTNMSILYNEKDDTLLIENIVFRKKSDDNSIQENGDSYLITEDAFTYKPAKDYPRPNGYLPSFIIGESKSKNVTFDINFVLTKQKAALTSATAQLNKDKDQLIVGKDLGNVHFIEKDGTLLFNGIRFKKETSQDITSGILKQLQFAMNQDLKVRYHQYGKRGLNNLRDHVTLGNITFDDSVLTATK